MGLLSPPLGHGWHSSLDESFEERKYDESVRIATGGRFPLASSTLIVFHFLISVRSGNVLVISLARRWITATKFGCHINALFKNVCTL